jgi:hypothetical protein
MSVRTKSKLEEKASKMWKNYFPKRAGDEN